jgi:hypothetical protein
MKKAFETLLTNIANIFKVKTLVTLVMTYIMVAIVAGDIKVQPEVLALYSTGYGSIMTYFFTKVKDDTQI